MPRIAEYNATVQDTAPQQPMERALQANEQIARTIGRFASQDISDREIANRGTEQVAAGMHQVGENEVKLAEAQGRASVDTARAIQNLVRSGGDIGEDIAKAADQHQTQQAKMDFYDATSAHYVQAQQDYKAALNQMAKNPDDPSPVIKYNQDQEQWFGQLREQFKGTEWGKQRVEEYIGDRREAEARAQLADQGNIVAGDHLNKMISFANNQADSVMTSSNPQTAYAFSSQEIEKYTRDMMDDPRLTPQQREMFAEHGRELQSTLAQGAVLAQMRKDPAVAQQMLQNGFGKDYLNGEQVARLSERVDAESRAQQTQQLAQQRQMKEQGEQHANQTINIAMSDPQNWMTGTFKPTDTFFKTIRQEATFNPYAENSLMRSAIEMGQRALREPAIQTNDADLLQHFNERAILPPGAKGALTYQEVMDANGRGLLTDKDTNRLMKDITDMPKDPQRQEAYKQFQDWMSAQRSAVIRPPIQGLPASPDQYRKWGDAQVALRQQFDNAYAAGKWRDLLDPSNASYMGRALADKYVSDPKGYNAGLPKVPVAPAAPPGQAVQPGVSPEDYLGLK